MFTNMNKYITKEEFDKEIKKITKSLNYSFENIRSDMQVLHNRISKQQNDFVSEGDIVMLKSGGPEMTVICKDEDNVICKWFRDSHCIEDDFNIKSIDRVIK